MVVKLSYIHITITENEIVKTEKQFYTRFVDDITNRRK